MYSGIAFPWSSTSSLSIYDCGSSCNGLSCLLIPYPHEVSSLLRGVGYVDPRSHAVCSVPEEWNCSLVTATQDLSTFHAAIPFRVGYQPVLPHTSIRIARGICQPVSGLSPDSGPVLGIPKVTSSPSQSPISSATPRICLSLTGPPPEPLVDHGCSCAGKRKNMPSAHLKRSARSR